jgi:hypothetical protein
LETALTFDKYSPADKREPLVEAAAVVASASTAAAAAGEKRMRMVLMR